MKRGIPNGIYSKEFREQAVKLVQDEGLSPEVVAKRLSIVVADRKSTHLEVFC